MSKKTVMKHRFSEVPKANIQRSVFNRSHKHMTTYDSGYLVPIMVDHCMPGDTFNMSTTAFSRMTTPMTAVMDNAKLTIHHWAVPYRLIWDNSQKFFGEQENPGDSTDYLIPRMTLGNVAQNSIHDYMGIPPQDYTAGSGTHAVNALWHRAYNLIYREHYRDQNLQDSPVVNKDDGPDAMSDYQLLRRGKRHDYFTSALPWPQKGEAIDLPLGDTAPITSTGNPIDFDTAVGDTDLHMQGADSGGLLTVLGSTSGTRGDVSFGTDTGLQADLTNATAATINSLRLAFQLQKMAEKDARGGTRYTEIIKAHFNVTSPDARLQRPEYLGGGVIDLSIHPVANTTGSLGTQGQEIPQGNIAAHATIAGGGIGFKKSFTEHCVIISIACVDADLTYQQGIHRMFDYRTKYDLYWPSLAHLGEQEVKVREIYATDNETTNDETFGYQERYAELRYFPSRISARFRNGATGSLKHWHLSEYFDTKPVLGDTFIQSNPPFEQVLAISDEPEFYGDFYFHYTCERPMPTFSVPGLIDHF